MEVVPRTAPQTKIGSKNADTMAAVCQATGKSTHFDYGAAAVLKRVIGLDCLQYSHASQDSLTLSGCQPNLELTIKDNTTVSRSLSSARSEERRVGKECRYRLSMSH